MGRATVTLEAKAEKAEAKIIAKRLALPVFLALLHSYSLQCRLPDHR